MVTYLAAMAASGAVVCVEGDALCPQTDNMYAGDIGCAAVSLHSVLRTSVVSLSVYSEALGNYNHTFLFSFHAQSAVPQLLHDDTWNCSVTYYDDFADHLACDLFRDCQGGEDEKDCPYISSACGGRQFEAGGSCFGISQRNVAGLTWQEAADRCSAGLKSGGLCTNCSGGKSSTSSTWDSPQFRTDCLPCNHLPSI